MIAEVETTELLDTLKSFFGFDGFKGNQEQIIKNVLNGKDTFATETYISVVTCTFEQDSNCN